MYAAINLLCYAHSKLIGCNGAYSLHFFYSPNICNSSNSPMSLNLFSESCRTTRAPFINYFTVNQGCLAQNISMGAIFQICLNIF